MKRLIKKLIYFIRLWLNDDKNIPKLNGGIISGNNVTVGKNVSLGGNVSFHSAAPISVGDNTMIGYSTIIHTSTHDYYNHPMWLERIDRPVAIGSFVWIGTGTIILPGVKIGDHAVVGAGSVVSAHVPSGAIVAGNPARIIGSRNLKNISKGETKKFNCNKKAVVIKKSFLKEDKVCKNKKYVLSK